MLCAPHYQVHRCLYLRNTCPTLKRASRRRTTRNPSHFNKKAGMQQTRHTISFAHPLKRTETWRSMRNPYLLR